jgi:hypothetical protein
MRELLRKDNESGISLYYLIRKLTDLSEDVSELEVHDNDAAATRVRQELRNIERQVKQYRKDIEDIRNDMRQRRRSRSKNSDIS